MLHQLRWMKIYKRIEFKSCLTTYKCLNNLAPTYLADFCILLSSSSLRKDLRSVDSRKLTVPKSKTVSYGDRSFPVAGPRLWNDLPVSLQSIHSLLKVLRKNLNSFFQ